jgi:hypothetical protein
MKTKLVGPALVALLLSILLLAACSEEESEEIYACETVDGELDTPEQTDRYENPFLRGDEADQWGWVSGVSSALRPHSHMVSAFGYRQNWLEEGDHFGIDIGQFAYGMGDLDLTVMVLNNFEQVPFKLVRVNGPQLYPTVQEMDLENPEQFVLEKQVSLADGEAFNFTLAVPASSFRAGPGAYDLRLVFIRTPETSDDVGVNKLPTSVDGYAFAVYYGGCDVVHATVDRGDARQELWTRITKQLVHTHDEFFLTPPTDIYDWKEIEHLRERRFRQLFETQSEEITLTLFPIIAGIMVSELSDQDVVFAVFENNRLVSTTRFEPSRQPDISSSYVRTAENRPVFDVPVTLAEQETKHVTVLTFTNPFGVPPYSVRLQNLASNIISVTRTTE